MVKNFIHCDMCLVHTCNRSTLEAELGVQSHLSYTLRSCFREKKATTATATTIKEPYLSHCASSGALLNIHGKKERKEGRGSFKILLSEVPHLLDFVLTFNKDCQLYSSENSLSGANSSRDTVNSENCKKKTSSTILNQI